MPLPVASAETLAIPPSAFNADHLAVLTVPGGRYGGDWSVSFMAGDVKCGEFSTAVDDRRKQALQSDPGYPDRAIETAFIWLMQQAREHGWRVVAWDCLNLRYSEADRPFFCLAQAIVASEAFVPSPGATYADEQTLDAVMGYVQGGQDR